MAKSDDRRARLDSVVQWLMAKPAYHRRGRLNADQKRQVLTRFAQGAEIDSIINGLVGEGVCIDITYLRNLAWRYGLTHACVPSDYDPAPDIEPDCDKAETVEKPKPGAHLEAYKKMRRGFHIPPEREPEFTQLLIDGLSREAAARAMGALS